MLLKGLNLQMAAGPNKLKPIILQTLHEEVFSILHLIFKKSMDTGTLPDVWKEANVSPIFLKRGHSRSLYLSALFFALCPLQGTRAQRWF